MGIKKHQRLIVDISLSLFFLHCFFWQGAGVLAEIPTAPSGCLLGNLNLQYRSVQYTGGCERHIDYRTRATITDGRSFSEPKEGHSGNNLIFHNGFGVCACWTNGFHVQRERKKSIIEQEKFNQFGNNTAFHTTGRKMASKWLRSARSDCLHEIMVHTFFLIMATKIIKVKEHPYVFDSN